MSTYEPTTIPHTVTRARLIGERLFHNGKTATEELHFYAFEDIIGYKAD